MTTINKPLTAEDFLMLESTDRPTELIRGEVVEMDPPGMRHGRLCSAIARRLSEIAEDAGLGTVFSNDAGVVTERGPDSVRAPDVSYYSAERLPLDEDPVGYWRAPPNLVCEVVSPSDRRADVLAKVAEFLRGGVDAVVVFDPEATTVEIFPATGPAIVARDAEIVPLPKPFDGLRLSAAEWMQRRRRGA